jgi:hypothetical protein
MLGNKDFLQVITPVENAEQMLHTKFMVFQHRSSQQSYIRGMTPLDVPALADVVDFVGGVTHLPNTPLLSVPMSIPPTSDAAHDPLSNTERRLESSVSQAATALPKNQIQIANPLAWRGENVTVMIFPRCKDGSLPKSLQDCPEAKGLRTLRVSLEPDDKSVPAQRHHFACDGGVFWPDVKTGKWLAESDIGPWCKPCSDYGGYHSGVDTYKLCTSMSEIMQPGGSKDDTFACMFTLPAGQLLGQPLTLTANLYMEHDDPGPAQMDGFCPPGTSTYMCGVHFTPQPQVSSDWLHKFYSIPAGMHGSGTMHGNAMSVVEFMGQSFDPVDVQQYLSDNGIPQQAVAKVIGSNSGFKAGDKATQDVEVMMSIAPMVPLWFWGVDGKHPTKGSNDEPFLKWLLDLAGTASPPLVHSCSYADDEATLPAAYTDRINSELMKAALRGVTILFSSGVDGAGGAHVRTMKANQTCGAFRPEFPASSPYVTSVGGTAVQRVGGQLTEVVSDSYLGVGTTSGGGFSNRYSSPMYQSAAVKYYKGHTKQPPNFNPKPSRRGYPDISSVSPNFEILKRHRSLTSMGGQSASTPTIAAMLSLLNDVRLKGGLPPLGFVNPLLYSLAQTYFNATHKPFRDIIYGNNRCSSFSGHCCKHGFEASLGWDACTGIGSPNFTVISNILDTFLGACLGLDCGGGTCSRGVCVCSDGYRTNKAGRCIKLPPFPIKTLEAVCGGIVGFACLIVICFSCKSEEGKPGCCTRVRRTIFPYKFVVVKSKKASAADGTAMNSLERDEDFSKVESAPILGNQEDYLYGAGNNQEDYSYGGGSNFDSSGSDMVI